MDRVEALGAVDELARIEDQIWLLAKQREANWKREYVALRRALQTQILRLAQIDPGQVGMTDDQARAFRTSINALRAAAALHQANWPVIIMDHDDPEYQRSAETIRTRSQQFRDFMRSVLEQGRPSHRI
jgi:hypothetical protein